MSARRPQEAIKEFSEQNCLDIPAADTIYRLLDSLGHTRRSVHSAVLDSVVGAALRHIQGTPLSPDMHLALLAQIRSYLWVPRLRQLPLALLARQAQQLIPPDIRDIILNTPDLYNACGVAIKRQLWLSDPLLFKAHMMPLIKAYVDNSELLEMSSEMSGGCAKRRREHPALTDIASSINSNLQLYMQTLGVVRELFLETLDTSLGTLRLDLAMAMHDNDEADVVNNDLCYALARSLDACITKQVMDDVGINELQTYFDELKTGKATYGEIALILSSPFVRHLQAQHILSILEDIAPNVEFSTRYADLTRPRTMLTMGFLADSLLEDPAMVLKFDGRVTRTFFPSILRFIKSAQNRDRLLGSSSALLGSGHGGRKRARLDWDEDGAVGGHDVKRSAAMDAVESGLEPTSDDFDILSSCELARQVLYAFLLKRVDNMDFSMLNLWLPTVTEILPMFLWPPATESTVRSELNSQANAGAANPEPRPVPKSSRLFAFEFDAFLFSLVARLKSVDFAVTTVLNSVDQHLGQDDGGIDTIQTPLIKLLDQAGRLRHCGHEQAIVFLTACAHALSTEYNSNSSSIRNKENAVYFVFALAEHAAAHYTVDSSKRAGLIVQYERLAAASPRQAFNYRICKDNCPNVARFLA
ncbi:hypothetical protein GGI20_001189 [Coemansia sp. BCRC 34301]|nr:hypothetical protein GGI20_001189 [Coemansia sp. BCRC 34301]